MAGNVGVQSSAIIVQGLANDEIKGSINNRLFKNSIIDSQRGNFSWIAIPLFIFGKVKWILL